MCTAIASRNQNTYFGRNLDLERGYGESVVITPRRFPIPTPFLPPLESHYAMIGMAAVMQQFPLYFDAMNEHGLSMAGLHFPGNAVYHSFQPGKDNIPPYAFIPWMQSQCASVDQAKQRLSRVNLVNVPFAPQLPLSPLHWMICDKEQSIVVESVESGLQVYDNPFEVLTNNPPFDFHRTNISHYMGLHTGWETNRFPESIPMENFSRGMGALGLPGDFSSTSRFVRAFFVKENAISSGTESSNVNQFFHILRSVAMPKGCVWTKDGFEYTRYSSCCNAHKGIYYYTTYHNPAIASVSLDTVDLDHAQLYLYPVRGLEESAPPIP